MSGHLIAKIYGIYQQKYEYTILNRNVYLVEIESFVASFSYKLRRSFAQAIITLKKVKGAICVYFVVVVVV